LSSTRFPQNLEIRLLGLLHRQELGDHGKSFNELTSINLHSTNGWALQRTSSIERTTYFIDRTHQYATTNDVLRQLAETDGGAHFDLDIKNIVDSLRRSTGSRYDGLQFFLVELSALVFWLGKRLLLIHDRRSTGLDFLYDAEICEHDKYFDSLIISMM
jgi:hypothetical protein